MEVQSLSVRVLLIDDDAGGFMLVRDLLSSVATGNFKLHWVRDYDAGLDEMSRSEYEVCLLDPRIGERDGLGLLQVMKEKSCTMPVILLTDHDSSEADLQAMRAGASDQLVKAKMSAPSLERSILHALERNKIEQKLRRANRVIRALNECKHAVIRKRDEMDLVQDICRIVVEIGGYRMAWVGYAEHDHTQAIRPVAKCGYEEGYLETLGITWKDTERGRGPVPIAIRTGSPSVVRSIETHADFALWREEAMKRGYASVIGVPLFVEGSVLGALAIYSAEPDAFDQEEVDLMAKLADDLAYGIETIRVRGAHRMVEAALQKSHSELERRVEERTAELSREIEERKAIQKALEKTKENYSELNYLMRRICDTVPDLIWAKDMNNRFIFINQSMCDKLLMCGHSENALGKSDIHFAQKERNAGYEHSFGELCVNSDAVVKEKKKPCRFLEDGLVRNRYLALDVHKAPLFDRSGEMIGTVGCGRVITTEKQVQEALRRSEEKYRELVESANSIIMRFDGEGNVTFMNRFAQEFFGYTEDELLGRSAIGTIVPEVESSGRDLMALISNALQNPDSYTRHENENMRKNGERVWVSWTNKLSLDEEGKLCEVLSIGNDITQRKKAEEELRSLPARLLAAQEEERKRIAHELHDSIGGALSNIKLNLQEALGLVEEERTAARESIQHLIEITEYSIDEARRIYMALRPSILDDLGIMATATWFCRQFESIHTGIRIDKHIEAKEEEIPEDLKIVLFRVMQEAFHNIAKYSKADLVALSICARDALLELSISDNGVGFDVGFAASRKTEKRGLGLSSMRERVELSGGVFSIESMPGQGVMIRAQWPNS